MTAPFRPQSLHWSEAEPYVAKMRGWPLLAVWIGAIAFSVAAWVGIFAALFSLTRGP